jgi:hypothetical protein
MEQPNVQGTVNLLPGKAFKGMVSISKDIFERLGQPVFVEVAYNLTADILSVRPSPEQTMQTANVQLSSSQEGSYSFSARNFLGQRNLFPKPGIYRTEFSENGMAILLYEMVQSTASG